MTIPSNFLKLIVRYGYVPYILIIINGLLISTIFYVPFELTVKALILLCIIGIAILSSFFVEKILPYNIDWNRSYQGDSVRDHIHFIVNESLSLGPSLLLPIIMLTAIDTSGEYWPSNWPILLQLLFALTLFDFSQYLVHWIAHTWPPLWKLHAVHHQVERMYGYNGILKHPLYQLISGSIGILPLALMGMPKSIGIAFSVLSVTQLLIQHSNVDYNTGWFKRLISTAEVHRYHHLKGTAGDVNFGFFFAFWDHLFGNAYDGTQKLKSTDIGLKYTDYPKSWAGQMIAPFRKHKPD